MQLIHKYGLNEFWSKRPAALFPVKVVKKRPRRSKKSLSKLQRRAGKGVFI